MWLFLHNEKIEWTFYLPLLRPPGVHFQPHPTNSFHSMSDDWQINTWQKTVPYLLFFLSPKNCRFLELKKKTFSVIKFIFIFQVGISTELVLKLFWSRRLQLSRFIIVHFSFVFCVSSPTMIKVSVFFEKEISKVSFSFFILKFLYFLHQKFLWNHKTLKSTLIVTLANLTFCCSSIIEQGHFAPK